MYPGAAIWTRDLVWRPLAPEPVTEAFSRARILAGGAVLDVTGPGLEDAAGLEAGPQAV